MAPCPASGVRIPVIGKRTNSLGTVTSSHGHISMKVVGPVRRIHEDDQGARVTTDIRCTHVFIVGWLAFSKEERREMK
jgi:hypothetical protein